MDTLKMRFKLHELEFEIEGQQDTVKEEFKNFNENILTQLLSKINITQLPNTEKPGIPEEKKPIEIGEGRSIDTKVEADFPTLKDVKMRDLPKSEPEWLLIYAFYASNFGKKEFTRAMLTKMYDDTDRKTDTRIGNIYKNMKGLISGLYLKSTNDTDYIILDAGKRRIQEILDGKSVAKHNGKRPLKPKSKSKNDEVETEVTIESVKQKSKASSLQQIAFIDLKYNVKEMTSLRDYFKERSAKSQNEEVLLAINWFMENKSRDGATLEEIGYVLKIATSKMPNALSQVLINLKGPKVNFVEKSADAKYSLTSLGIMHIADNFAKGDK
jgi:hypothetical protein